MELTTKLLDSSRVPGGWVCQLNTDDGRVKVEIWGDTQERCEALAKLYISAQKLEGEVVAYVSKIMDSEKQQLGGEIDFINAWEVAQNYPLIGKLVEDM